MRRLLLLARAIAGPLYVGIGAIEAAVRDGFDLRVHPLSVLANGSGGWVHSVMMIITGSLVVLGALGLRLRNRQPRATVVGLIVYGLGVGLGDVFIADPIAGFPVGTPPPPPSVPLGTDTSSPARSDSSG